MKRLYKYIVLFGLLLLSISFSSIFSHLADINLFWSSVLKPNEEYSIHEYSSIYSSDNTISVNQAKIARKYLIFSELVYGQGTYSDFSIVRMYKDISTGLDAKVYINKSEAILAFRGSEFGLQDWITDAQHSSNFISEQYLQAISLAKIFNQEFSSYKRSVTGHSLGGGLAMVAALAHNIDGVVFDATGINIELIDYIYQNYHQSNNERMREAALNIKNYNFEGEFVSDSDNQQDADVAGDKTYQIGAIHYVTNQRFSPVIPFLKTPISLHFIQPLAEELDLLSNPKCRMAPNNLEAFNNHLDKKALNERLSPCWKDKTLDDWDVMVWQFRYVINSVIY